VIVGTYSPWGTYCYVTVRRVRLGGARRFFVHRGRRGAGHIVAAPAQLIFLFILVFLFVYCLLFILLLLPYVMANKDYQ